MPVLALILFIERWEEHPVDLEALLLVCKEGRRPVWVQGQLWEEGEQVEALKATEFAKAAVGYLIKRGLYTLQLFVVIVAVDW